MKECEKIRDKIEERVIDGLELSQDLKHHIEGCGVCRNYYDWLTLNREQVLRQLSSKPSVYQWANIRAELYKKGLIRGVKGKPSFKILVTIFGLISVSFLSLFAFCSFLINYLLSIHTFLGNLRTFIIGIKIFNKLLVFPSILEKVFTPVILNSISQFLVLLSISLFVCFMITIIRYMRMRLIKINNMIL
jgi:hypothetical protein